MTTLTLKHIPRVSWSACLAALGIARLAAASEPLSEDSGDDEAEVYEAVAEVAPPPRQATERKLEAAELLQVPGTLGDPLRGVELLPGVARSPDGEPIVRGAAQHESAVFIDGSSVPYLYHFGGLRSVVHPRLIEQVELYPGNFSARYGRATGGVVEAALRDPRRDAPHLELELSLIDSSVLVEAPLGEAAGIALAARRSNIDVAFDAFVPERSFDAIVAPVYWDYQGILRLDLGSERRLRFSFLGSRDELELLFATPNSENATLRGSLAGAAEYHRGQVQYDDTRGPVVQKLQAYAGFQRLSQSVGSNDAAYFEVLDFGGRAEWTLPLGDSLDLGAGLDLSAGAFEGAYRGSAAPASEGSLDTPSDVRDQIVIGRTRFLLINPAAYVEARYFAHPDLLLIPGVRVDYYHQLRELTINPRLSQRYAWTETLTLKSGVGWYSQPPEYYEAVPGVGNPDIDPYHALHVGAGVEWQPHEQLSLDLDGFFKFTSGRVVSTPGSAPPGFINDGRGRIFGVETGTRYQSSFGLDAQLSYTLSRSERADRDEAWRLFDRDQTHVLGIAAGYDLGAGWRAGVRFRFISGNPVTPIAGSVYDAGTDQYYPRVGAQNSERDPAFDQLDVRIDKRFDFGPVGLSVYLDIQNVYAAENPEGFTYSYDYSEREAASGSPFFPNLGLRGEL